MPFTGSHPAAVLPLLRTPLPASALVLGSLAPDILFYLPRSPAWPTHTLRAVVTVDTALAAAAWALWHGVLSRPALAAAPAGLRARVAGRVRPGLRPRMADARSIARVVAGLAAGAATHVLWDEFTHDGRWGPRHLGVLSEVRRGQPAHVWAQDGSGVLGAGLLLAWFGRWWRRTPADPRVVGGGAPWAWAAVGTAGLVVGAAGARHAADRRTAAETAALRGGRAATAVWLALALAWHARTARTAQRPPRPEPERAL